MRIGAALAALLIAALAASWYFRDGDETVDAAPASQLVQFQPGSTGPAETRGPSRVTRTSGLQTTVPDTLGYDEHTATLALEQGGFRVRVMYHEVSTVKDEGIVVQQLPRGGVTRRLDWIVTIVVGTLR